MSFADLPESVKAEYGRIGRERERASREMDRLYRWELVRVCGEMIAWTLLGLVMVGFAFAVTDFELGLVFLYGGMVLNSAGVAISLWTAYRRGEERGDW